MCSAILAFVTHPSVLVVAHAEMDNIIGANRTPTFDDEMKLPYICASMSKNFIFVAVESPVDCLGVMMAPALILKYY
jgi:hypothetical protein